MKIRLPSLRTVVHDAHKNGAVANRFRFSPQDVAGIRKGYDRLTSACDCYPVGWSLIQGGHKIGHSLLG
jgi:hypothetical protein